MPRPAREFTDAEIKKVRQMQTEGKPRGEICRELGITTSAFVWYVRTNRFGVLPKKPGRGVKGNKLQRADIPGEGQLFGCKKEEWQGRQKQIRDSWPEDEALKRSKQRTPNCPDLYSKFKHSPFRDEKQQKGRQNKWPYK